MPVAISQALDDQASAADTKFQDIRKPGRYLISSMLAGAYIGVAVVLLLAVTSPLSVADSPWTKLIQGLVFGIALTLVVFAGAELSTGNMMTMVHGVFRRRAGVVAAATVILFSLVGNLIGSVLFAWLVHASGVLSTGATPDETAPGLALLTTVVTAKSSAPAAVLFFRGVLCNFLVCLAVWQAARAQTDGAKLVVIFWCLLAFIGSGFEHVVANMTVFSLGMFAGVPAASLGAFATNVLWVGLGNLVGGGLLVGATYGMIGSRQVREAAVPEAVPSMAPAAGDGAQRAASRA
ncbi:MAG: formate/nitrite transporter [Streptosporangiales bacterium]|nr:formate/nitrite transporter [Streptosporangiales bacterium]